MVQEARGFGDCFKGRVGVIFGPPGAKRTPPFEAVPKKPPPPFQGVDLKF